MESEQHAEDRLVSEFPATELRESRLCPHDGEFTAEFGISRDVIGTKVLEVAFMKCAICGALATFTDGNSIFRVQFRVPANALPSLLGGNVTTIPVMKK